MSLDCRAVESLDVAGVVPPMGRNPLAVRVALALLRHGVAEQRGRADDEYRFVIVPGARSQRADPRGRDSDGYGRVVWDPPHPDRPPAWVAATPPVVRPEAPRRMQDAPYAREREGPQGPSLSRAYLRATAKAKLGTRVYADFKCCFDLPIAQAAAAWNVTAAHFRECVSRARVRACVGTFVLAHNAGEDGSLRAGKLACLVTRQHAALPIPQDDVRARLSVGLVLPAYLPACVCAGTGKQCACSNSASGKIGRIGLVEVVLVSFVAGRSTTAAASPRMRPAAGSALPRLHMLARHRLDTRAVASGALPRTLVMSEDPPSAASLVQLPHAAAAVPVTLHRPSAVLHFGRLHKAGTRASSFEANACRSMHTRPERAHTPERCLIGDGP